MIEGKKSLRVLSIDGGGMRGVYSSTYLSVLAKELAAYSDKNGHRFRANSDTQFSCFLLP